MGKAEELRSLLKQRTAGDPEVCGCYFQHDFSHLKPLRFKQLNFLLTKGAIRCMMVSRTRDFRKDAADHEEYRMERFLFLLFLSGLLL